MELSLRRSVLQCATDQPFTPLQLNPIAKAVFGLASVTFEVRACNQRIRRRDDA